MSPWKKDVPEVTNASYARWLRAGRPPFEFFLGLSDLEQECLAGIGDEFVQDICVAIGYGVADPQAADAAISAVDDPAEEEALLRQMVAGAARRSLGNDDAPPGPTMGGVSERGRATRRAREIQRVNEKSFLGQKPEMEMEK